jgi:hypothetical protein
MDNREFQRDWGSFVWAVILPVAIFLATKHLWFDNISNGDKAMFWTNVFVAIGTLALAIATTWNIRQTNKVIAGEDRRHQQQFAPLVQVNDYTHGGTDYQSGVTAFNIGYGLAIDVQVVVRGTQYFNDPIEVEVSPEEFKTRLAAAVGGLSYTNRDGRRFINELVARSAPFDAVYLCSAIKAGDANARFYDKRIEDKLSWSGRIEYDDVTITYFDMFGNRYQTIYKDREIATYSWRRPVNLEML